MVINITDIFRSLINNISYDIEVKSIIDNLDGTYRINTCNTLHLRVGMFLGAYEVTDVSINSYFILAGSGLNLNTNTFTLPTFGFERGSLIDVDGERGSKKRMQLQVTPFLWVREPFTETLLNNELSRIYGNFDLELYFMGDNNPMSLQDEIYEDVVNPIYNFVHHFIDYMNSREDIFSEIRDIQIVKRTNAGVTQERRLFDENLSGVEMRLRCDIVKSCSVCLT